MGLAALAAAYASSIGASPTAAPAPHPNVVVIESDDQTADSMRYMPRTEQLIGDAGVQFPQSFVNYSLCCPSRATFLTGQYAHNHGVLDNEPPQGGFDKLDSANTLPVWLQRAGYYTGLIGKYLNGYESHRADNPPLIPPGYSEWHGSTITYFYYGYELNENGSLVSYGRAEGDYSTDVYTAKAVDFIARRAPQPQPFFLWLAYLAPHIGGPDPNPQPPKDCHPTADGTNLAKPAPRHAHVLDQQPLPMPPSFNESDLSDKPPGISDKPRLTAADVAEVTRSYRCASESLLAIDQGVEQVIGALQRSGELDDTIVVYTSDNGFMQGEHRLRLGKVVPYEESIRVPLLIRGPGFGGGRAVNDLVINADLAPTILEATGAAAGLAEDGRALQTLAAEPSRERGRALLVETNTYRALRTRRYLYAEHYAGPSAGATELYDLYRDPYELQNLHADPDYEKVRGALARLLHELQGCAGSDCRPVPNLQLKLLARHARGASCKAPPVKVEPEGGDLGQVRQAELFVNGNRVGSDSKRPFRRKAPYGLLEQRGNSTVRMRLSLLDGRRLTRDVAVHVCR